MMKNILVLFLFTNIQLLAFSDLDIAKAIKDVAKREDVDMRILHTIVSIESNFEPFVIAMTTTKENAKAFKRINDKNVRIVASEYKYNKKKWILSFYPNSLAMAKALARAFKTQKFSFDVGLSQINTTNFKMEEIDYIFDPKYNLSKSSKILKECQRIKKNIIDTIECYNYGTKKRNSNPYYNRFKSTFMKNFGA